MVFRLERYTGNKLQITSLIEIISVNLTLISFRFNASRKTVAVFLSIRAYFHLMSISFSILQVCNNDNY